jgi:signal transduction histidine kinase
MRSLAVKLSLAFLFVGLIGAVVLAIIIRQRTRVEFDQFVQSRDRGRIAEILADYYQSNESWRGVNRVFDQLLDSPMAQDMGYRRMMQGLVITLADEEGVVLYSNRPGDTGISLSARELSNATEIVVDGETAGLLLLRLAQNPFAPGTPERLFLSNVNQAIILGALLAVLVALLLGGFFAYSLTRSLRELTAATREIAGGDLGYQVEVRSRDELGELAVSFNQMSADLAKSNQARRQMTADIAHDLRSPLSVILGYAEALNDGKLEGSPEVFGVIHREAGQLSHLIDDLRTLSLADSGELPLEMQPVSAQEILVDVSRAYRQQAESRGITLVVDTAADLPEIMADPNRLNQVLGNLMSNALRYTPPGGRIVLGTRMAREQVLITVQDNGKGIAGEDLEYIFDRFFRSDPSRSDNGETGLGLAIARSLVELQGGEISAESEPGQGTTIMIRFPV